MEQFPALNTECFDQHIAERLNVQEPPRILILYGSVRERSYSRFAAEDWLVETVFRAGAICRVFHAGGHAEHFADA